MVLVFHAEDPGSIASEGKDFCNKIILKFLYDDQRFNTTLIYISSSLTLEE